MKKITLFSDGSAYGHNVNAIWVRGHEENKRCDKLARDEAQKMKDSL